MIGRKEAVEVIVAGKDVKSIILVVGKAPKWFDAATQDGMDIPMVYTGLVRPKPWDCSFAKGQTVQLIHGEMANDRMFAAWYLNLKKHNPKFLVALDSEGEIYAE